MSKLNKLDAFWAEVETKKHERTHLKDRDCTQCKWLADESSGDGWNEPYIPMAVCSNEKAYSFEEAYECAVNAPNHQLGKYCPYFEQSTKVEYVGECLNEFADVEDPPAGMFDYQY